MVGEVEEAVEEVVSVVDADKEELIEVEAERDVV